MVLGIYLIQQLKQAIRWFPALLLCHTLVLLPAVYPTHLAYRLKADYAAQKACCTSAKACHANHAAASTKASGRCCSAEGNPDASKKPGSCPVCREFTQFVLMQFTVITVPEYVQNVLPVDEVVYTSLTRRDTARLLARAPPITHPFLI